MNPHDIKALLGKSGVLQVAVARETGVSPSMINAVIFRRVKSRRVASAIALAVDQPLSKLWPEIYQEEDPTNGAGMHVLGVLCAAEQAADSPMLAEKIAQSRGAVGAAIVALELAEKTMTATLAARGYVAGSCTDQWSQEVRDEVAALASVRAALDGLTGNPTDSTRPESRS